MRIAILVEGRTEKAFLPFLREFLKTRLAGKMPKFDPVRFHSRIPTGTKLCETVMRLFQDRKNPADAVIALTDVYTGQNPTDFQSAEEAKQKMSEWVGNESRFYPHVAQYEFEAWLLPYWSRIQTLTGSNRTAPGNQPEKVNHNQPPSHHLSAIFKAGRKTQSYVKTRDSERILRDQDLMEAIGVCPELKAFVNTIINLCDPAQIIP